MTEKITTIMKLGQLDVGEDRKEDDGKDSMKLATLAIRPEGKVGCCQQRMVIKKAEKKVGKMMDEKRERQRMQLMSC